MADSTSSETYSVIVTGQIAEGFELAQVKANMGKLFKLAEAQVDKLFAGKPVALRRGMDKDTAVKMAATIKKVGAVVSVKVAKAAPVKATAKQSDVSSQAAGFTPDICCPRCGHEQKYATACSACHTDLQLHIMRLKRKEKIRDFRRQNAG